MIGRFACLTRIAVLTVGAVREAGGTGASAEIIPIITSLALLGLLVTARAAANATIIRDQGADVINQSEAGFTG
jgi:hypothetical protein